MPYKIVNGELVAETDKNYISLSSSKRELFDALKTQVQRAEAAEARAADEELRAKSWHDSAMTLADQRDAAYKRNEELEARSTDAENHNANLLREVEQWRIHVDHVEAERDELRRQLSEAQHAIDAMAQIVGAADEVKHQLEQARSDIEDYRARVNELFDACGPHVIGLSEIPSKVIHPARSKRC